MKKNKLLTTIVSCALLVNSIAFVPVMANGVETSVLVNGKINIHPSPDDTLSVNTYADSYQWYSSDSVDGTYSAVANATDPEYVVRWNDEGKYFKCELGGGETTYAETAYAVKTTPFGRQKRVMTAPVNYKVNTPGENVFTIDGKEFILLDTRNNDKAKFFVITKDFYGSHSFATDGIAKFDVNNQNNIAYWLNNDFLTNGNGGTELPEAIKKHIDYDYVWKTEAGLKESTYSEDYYTVGGIALLSQTEWIKYTGKFGVKDLYSGLGWWLRSTRAADINYESPLLSVVDYAPGGVNWIGQTSQNQLENKNGIRPVFNLDRNFFLDNVIDLSLVGSNIQKIIYSEYTDAELTEAGYDTSYLSTVVTMSVNGQAATNASPDDTLSVNYNYIGTKPIDKSEVLYQWYEQEGDSFAEISGETDSEYIVRWNDEGKTIKCGVQITFGGVTREFYSDVVCISKTALYRQKRVDTPIEEWRQNTPEENVFEFEGKQFILLDVKNNDKAKFFVMTKDFYGNHSFATDGIAKFDVNNQNNIAYWLNNDFLTNGNDGAELPEAIKGYIDYDYVWKTEPGLSGTTYPTEYYTKAGLSLMSQTEWIKYTGKFGVKDLYSGLGWWLRSTRAADINYESPLLSVVDFAPGGVNWIGQTSQNQLENENGIRPIFHLNRVFFLENNIDSAKLGNNVKQTLFNEYSAEELEMAGYDISQLKTNIQVLTNGSNSYAASPDDTVSVSFTYGNNEEIQNVDYQWYKQEEDTFAEINGETGSEYIVRWDDEGKKLKCGVTITDKNGYIGNEVFSDSLIVSHTEYRRQERVSTPISGWQQDTPEENVFELGGKQFILLDVKNNNEAKFFVMTKDIYGNHSFATDGIAKFDVNNQNNIAYWLNNDFLTNGNGGAELPEAIKRHIDYDYVWKTEPGLANTTYPNEYYTKAGLSLMSQTEWIKYTGKFGVKDLYSGLGWWLRTSRAQNMSEEFPMMSIVDFSSGGVRWIGQTSQNQSDNANGIRPVFYLDKDFFKDNKLDKIGANVKSIIKELYTRDEMAKLYTSSELVDIGYLPDYEVSDAIFTADGEETIMPEGNVAASFTITNNRDSSESVIVYAAAYLSDKLQKVSQKEYTLQIGKNSINIELDDISADSMKIFVWSKGTMKPISDKVLEL